MFSSSSVRRSFLLPCLLIVAGCTAKSEKPAEAGLRQASAAISSGLEGMAACDDYVAQRIACFHDVHPSHQASQEEQALRRKQERWAALADTEFKRMKLGLLCNDKLQAAAEHFPGCTWNLTSGQ